MAATTFTNGVTLTDAAWFQDVDTVTYTLFGNGSAYTGVLTGTTGSFIGAATTKNMLQIGTGSSTQQGFILGNYAANTGGLWGTNVTPSSSNFSIAVDSSSTHINGQTGGNVSLRINNVVVLTTSSTGSALTGLLDLTNAASGQIGFPATQNASSGANVLDDYVEGTFTGSYTGCTTVPTGTIKYTKVGNQVTLLIPTFTGTSNTTAKTITGMPVAIRPSATIQFPQLVVDNGGSNVLSMTTIASTGVITGYPTVAAGNWTNSGTAIMGNALVSYTIA